MVDSRTGAPTGGITARAYNGTRAVVASSQTGSSGAYALTCVAAGRAEVGLATGCGASRYVTQYYKNKPSLVSAVPVSALPA